MLLRVHTCHRLPAQELQGAQAFLQSPPAVSCAPGATQGMRTMCQRLLAWPGSPCHWRAISPTPLHAQADLPPESWPRTAHEFYVQVIASLLPNAPAFALTVALAFARALHLHLSLSLSMPLHLSLPLPLHLHLSLSQPLRLHLPLHAPRPLRTLAPSPLLQPFPTHPRAPLLPHAPRPASASTASSCWSPCWVGR